MILCAGAYFVSKKQSEKQYLVYQTIVPQVMTITQKKIISGNLYPIREIEVKSSVSGTLEEYYVQIGDVIKVGDKIAKIKMSPEPTQVETAKTNLIKSRIEFENNQINYEREAQLYEKGVISLSDFETTSKVFNISKEQYKSAKNQLSLLEEGYVPNSNISNVVMATSDGVLIDLPLDVGMPVTERNTFREGSTIALIAQMDSFIFKGKVVESDMLSLRKGLKINVIPTSQSGLNIDATISKISPKGYWDQSIMKYDVEAVMNFPDSILVYSGFNAIAEFIVKEKKDVLAIPEKCIKYENDSAYVQILQNGEFVKKMIITGISDGMNIEVMKGLTEKSKLKHQ